MVWGWGSLPQYTLNGYQVCSLFRSPKISPENQLQAIPETEITQTPFLK